LGWFLDSPVPAQALRARELIISGGIPVVPALWRHEVANGVVMAERRGRLKPEQIKTIANDLDEFSEALQSDPVVVRSSVLIEEARRTNLTVYDAAYLELAARRNLPLATLDLKLAQAARRAGVLLI
jgi:predicted nucleic acid-binding protein